MRAADMKAILDSIVQPPKGTAAAEKGALVVEGGYKVFEDVLIAAETDDEGGSANKRGGGNRLIIAANRDDWKRLEDFIEKLDKPQPQVAIEVMIVDVVLGQIKDLGVQNYNIRGKPLAKNVNADFTNLAAYNQFAIDPNTGAVVQQPMINIADGPLGSENASWISFGRAASPAGSDPTKNNMWAILRSVYNIDNSQVISQPYAIVNNNQSAEITLKSTQRVQGGMDTGKTISAVIKQISLDATISVKITPHVALNGIVDLDINIDIGDFTGTVNGSLDQPVRTTRALITKSSMLAGEVLILGGLKNSNLVETINKTPVLSSIPLLGTFLNKKEKIKKNRIYMCLFVQVS